MQKVYYCNYGEKNLVSENSSLYFQYYGSTRALNVLARLRITASFTFLCSMSRWTYQLRIACATGERLSKVQHFSFLVLRECTS